MVGMNFADKGEATNFCKALEASIQRKGASMLFPLQQCIPWYYLQLAGCTKHLLLSYLTAIHRKPSEDKPELLASTTSRPPAGPITSENDPFSNKSKGRLTRPKTGGKKLTKADISTPSDFKLVQIVNF